MDKPKFDSYWIAEVSLRKGNPVHRIFAWNNMGEHWELWNGGYERIIPIYEPTLIQGGGSFKLIREVFINQEGEAK